MSPSHISFRPKIFSSYFLHHILPPPRHRLWSSANGAPGVLGAGKRYSTGQYNASWDSSSHKFRWHTPIPTRFTWGFHVVCAVPRVRDQLVHSLTQWVHSTMVEQLKETDIDHTDQRKWPSHPLGDFTRYFGPYDPPYAEALLEMREAMLAAPIRTSIERFEIQTFLVPPASSLEEIREMYGGLWHVPWCSNVQYKDPRFDLFRFPATYTNFLLIDQEVLDSFEAMQSHSVPPVDVNGDPEMIFFVKGVDYYFDPHRNRTQDYWSKYQGWIKTEMTGLINLFQDMDNCHENLKDVCEVKEKGSETPIRRILTTADMDELYPSLPWPDDENDEDEDEATDDDTAAADKEDAKAKDRGIDAVNDEKHTNTPK